ncbi:hypothetical protein [Parvicella tangerina]|uniref:Lipoprotein n=1 Tax=Parvicella tangerina TaxID=2829795 RepID=A0A916JL55_9FLAO|nr:hypothetical protein [Parvicella tangerina]CAG5079950.1 hypothetical protein CRYO30217_01130 [Parvicella tangerina]
MKKPILLTIFLFASTTLYYSCDTATSEEKTATSSNEVSEEKNTESSKVSTLENNNFNDEVTVLKYQLLSLHSLMGIWVYNPSNESSFEKVEAQKLLDEIIKNQLQLVHSSAEKLADASKLDLVTQISEQYGSLSESYVINICSILTDYASYSDIENTFMAQATYQDLTTSAKDLLQKIDQLIAD